MRDGLGENMGIFAVVWCALDSLLAAIFLVENTFPTTFMRNPSFETIH